MTNAGIPRRTRSQRAFRAGDACRFSGPKGYHPQAETERQTYTPQNQTGRQGLKGFFTPRPCLWTVWRITLACKLAVRQSPSDNVLHRLSESCRIVQLVPKPILAMIETERLCQFGVDSALGVCSHTNGAGGRGSSLWQKSQLTSFSRRAWFTARTLFAHEVHACSQHLLRTIFVAELDWPVRFATTKRQSFQATCGMELKLLSVIMLTSSPMKA